ncbi:hypothetical protein Bhyg_07548 [Pseudolycoriella hygida]|uniref:Uncharacterized protein n=1 Tax=Pseudolycoriella hygida TaxID=35572 RepID=A0A9Q0S3Y0_9DIPT|nr:hypothetical protein Bhyg_07548 [Pseudolycoriella hygida]
MTHTFRIRPHEKQIPVRCTTIRLNSRGLIRAPYYQDHCNPYRQTSLEADGNNNFIALSTSNSRSNSLSLPLEIWSTNATDEDSIHSIFDSLPKQKQPISVVKLYNRSITTMGSYELHMMNRHEGHYIHCHLVRNEDIPEDLA